MDHPVVQPFAVGAAARQVCLDLIVGHDPVALEVHEKELPRPQPALGHHLVRGRLEHPCFRCEHHPAVPGHDPAARAQPVAVERRADHLAVGERDRGRAVPGLDQRRVVCVEVTDLPGELEPPLEGLRDQHRDRVGRRAATEHQQLHQPVERGRIGDVVAQEAADLLDVVAEQGRGERQLARAMPVAIAAQRVDLTVVGEHPIGVRQLPARKGVGGKARVDERQARANSLVLQIWEVLRDLGCGQHPLVDEGATGEPGDRQARKVELLDAAPDHIELSLERVLVIDAVPGRDEEMADHRGDRARGGPAVLLDDRDVAPAEHALALLLHPALQRSHRLRARFLVAREKADRHPVAPLVGQLEAGDLPEEGVGQLDQDAGAVAGVRVGALGAPVLEVLERPQRSRDHLV